MPVERFGSLVTLWPAEKLPNGVSPDCRNVRFTPSSVMTREGLTRVFSAPLQGPVLGLGGLITATGRQCAMVLDSTGELYQESTPGSGTLTALHPPDAVPGGSFMNCASAYGHAYMAISDGRTGVVAPVEFDGVNVDSVGVAAAAGSANAGDSPDAGNIAAGLRYGVVLFRTRSGYLSAPQAPFQWTAAGGKQAAISSLPLGPPQVTARVVAFTVAGGSSAGPYFYIGASDTINGVQETSTVVEDNTTTQATFNFDDAFLAASTDCTVAFRKIVLVAETGIIYSPTTRRLLWWGEAAQPSLLRVSEPDDPETYLGDTGFVLIAENNGERLTCCFEYRSQIIAGKEHSIYLVTPNSGDPATWSVSCIAQKIGICGPRALAISNDIAIFAHRSGVYLFNGGDPTLISLEIDNLWKQVNWRYGHTIWADIDAETQQARIGVPMGASTAPSEVFKVDFSEGWNPPVVFSRFAGIERAYPGRKWSRDSIAAFQLLRLERTVPEGPLPGAFAPSDIDSQLSTSQLLVASSTEAAVHQIDPTSRTDNGAPIEAFYQTAFLNATQNQTGSSLGMLDLGGVTVSAQGEGNLCVEAISNDADTPRLLRNLPLTPVLPGDQRIGCRVRGERIALRMRVTEPGAHFEVQRLALWLRTAWTTRTQS